MKKGDSHIDWALSLGIFLVYILFLFLFIKPGVREIYEEKNLISIAENNFQKSAVSMVERIPIVLSSSKIELNSNILNGASNSDWAVASIDYQIISSQFSSGNLKAEAGFSTGEIMWLLNSNDFDYSSYSAVVSCTAASPCSSINQVGTSEIIEGVSENKLDYLLSLNSEELKSLWGYPSNAGLNISVIYSSQYNYSAADINYQLGESPLIGVGKIAVKEWKTFLIEDSSILKPIIINIRVWKK